MFLMYDLNMNEIEFPEGFIPLDIFISSIDKDRITDKVEGGNRKLNYGSTYNERDIQLSILLKAHDTQDYRLLRDATYALFNKCDSFYLVEKYQRGKRYLVSVDEKYIPDRMTRRHATATINCITIGLPFAESIGTSADIDNTELIPLIPDLWTQGYWVNIIGGNGTATSNNAVRVRERITVNPDTKYIVKNDSDDATLTFSLYNDAGYKRRITINAKSEIEITTNNDVIKAAIHFSTSSTNNEDITPVDIGSKLIGSVRKKTYGINSDDELWGFGMGLIADEETQLYKFDAVVGQTFRMYNPSSIQELHPFECDLKITIKNVVGSIDKFQIINLSNGSRANVTKKLNSNDVLVYDGPNITINNLQALRDTRRDFVSLAPGWNNFQIYHCDSATVEFDFRFYYY